MSVALSINEKVLECAACKTARLPGVEQLFDDRTLKSAHHYFPRGVGLGQLLVAAAELNGKPSNYSTHVTLETQQAAFGMLGGFSPIDTSTILSNIANKFLKQGWNAVDMTPLKIAAVRPVTDLRESTTVSLFGDLAFEKVGPTGEIKHGKLGEETYNNKAETYARMLTITREDILNDDLGALTTTPQKLGRGAALSLNNIFWEAFLNNSAFFTSGRANVSTDTGALGLVGLQQAEAVFMAQTDPNGDPLNVEPEILLVPTPLKTTAKQLMSSEAIKGASDGLNGNPYRDRFRVESSPYMSNANFTGNSAQAWYLLADPAVLPVIEIVALNGRVEPVVETAEASFTHLGIQMRGYSDVGVEKQEYRGGVRSDGSVAD